MILYFSTKVNRNGNTTQLIIDTDEKTVQHGSFLFNACFKTCFYLSKTDLIALYEETKQNDYTDLIKLY